MADLTESIAYFEGKYDLIARWMLTPTGNRVVLGDQQHRTCRFCGRAEPQATFRSDAHAIPELFGNRNLLTAQECDDCNRFFGQGMENHLGNWSKPARTFSRIRGKSGIPTLKRGSSGGWRIEPSDAHIEIKDEEDPIPSVDELTRTLTLRVPRDTYIPAEVLKAFVKIGITLLPPDELSNFKTAITWLTQSELQPTVIVQKLPLLHSFRPGPGSIGIVALILRRQPAIIDVPYALLALSYGNEVFQVSLPSERDAHLHGQSVELRIFPFPMPHLPPDLSVRVGPPKYEVLDMTSREPVKGQIVEVALNFDSFIERVKDDPATTV